MKPFLQQIQQLEKKLLSDFRKKGFEPKSFPTLAHQHLSNFNQPFHFEDYLEWIIQQNKHPDIHHYDLNLTENVHFTLTRNPHFFIEIYSWINHTEIHAHNFSGAFRVLKGRYAQSRYAFKKEKQSQNWATGTLTLKTRETVSDGATFPITEGESFIHQVMHFDLPCISLCVRTPDTKKRYYSYFHPGLRVWDTTFSRPEILRLKAYGQLKNYHSVSDQNYIKLLSGLSTGRLLYEYMNGLGLFQQLLKIDEHHIQQTERYLKEVSGLNVRELKRQHLLHLNKLELCEN